VASLADRRSVRRTQRRTLDPQQLQHAIELRHQRLHLRHIVRLLHAPFLTVARTLSRLGLGRLRNLDPKPPVQRYEWERPGDLIHIDIKSLARFRKVGHRITGDRQQGRSTGVGYEKAHVDVDDATRLTYAEVLALCIINCYLQLVSRQDCSFPLSPTPSRLIAATPAAALLGLYAIL